jgi:hypothetical protein
MDIENQKDHLKDLADIRSMMESSTKYLSLSGKSGIFVGIYALIGAVAAYYYLGIDFLTPGYYEQGLVNGSLNISFLMFFALDAFSVLFLSLITVFAFTYKKAKKNGQPMLGRNFNLLLLNLFAPLITGGIFILVLLNHQIVYLVAPTTLIFYGLGLLNAAKYTYKDIHYLGICEIILGLISCFFVGFGLLFWAFGFGLLHIFYGSLMYLKYEKTEN